MPYALRFMHKLSRLMRRAPARQIARDYGISTGSALRMDRWVLSEEMPVPSLDNVGSIIIDEKHLGHTFGFITLVLNAKTGEPFSWAETGMGHASKSSFALLPQAKKRHPLSGDGSLQHLS